MLFSYFLQRIHLFRQQERNHLMLCMFSLLKLETTCRNKAFCMTRAGLCPQTAVLKCLMSTTSAVVRVELTIKAMQNFGASIFNTACQR